MCVAKVEIEFCVFVLDNEISCLDTDKDKPNLILSREI